jgi:hypothetical protein
MVRCLALLLVGLITGCGSDDGGAGGTGPAPPEPDPCAESETHLATGACELIGVPPEACSEGFEPDGMLGCRPLLPTEPCPLGQMAIPGETACRPVAPCGSGKWGDIPVEPSTQYVDQAYTGTDPDGSPDHPWRRIGDGVDAAAADAIVAIAAGSYEEYLNIQLKAVRLWAVCPAEVEVVAPPSEPRVMLLAGSVGMEVRDIAFRSPVGGVVVSDVTDVLFDRVWIHDVADRGLTVESTFAPAAVTLRRSLIERVVQHGVFVQGSELTVEESVVRDVAISQDGSDGYAVNIVMDGDGLRSEVVVRRSLFERVDDAAVLSFGCGLEIDGSVVRDAGLGHEGRGSLVVFQSEEDFAVGANGSVRGSYLAAGLGAGIFVSGSEVMVSDTTVEAIGPEPDSVTPRVIGAQSNSAYALRSSLTVERSTLRHEVGMGMFVGGTDAIIDHTLIEGDPNGATDLGMGMAVIAPLPFLETSVSLRSSALRYSREFGLGAYGATVLVDQSVVEDVAVTPMGTYGDGILVRGYADAPGQVDLDGSRVANASRAGLAAFDAAMSLRDTDVLCTSIALNGESLVAEFAFSDLGGNLCACDELVTQCQVLSTGIQPPEPPPFAP